ncbi:hypothetical protein [Mucilaginibacter pineti]|nr:hypothetical protein [Mucilaginibacter pineti]
MQKKISLLTLIFVLGFSAWAVAQVQKSSPTNKEPITCQQLVPEVFGNYFLFTGFGLYPESSVWEKSNFKVGDTALYEAFEMINKDRQKIDSLKKLYPVAYMVESRPKSKVMLGLKLNPILTQYLSADAGPNAKYIINDSSNAILIALGINAANVNDYRYHVVASDGTEITTWLIPQLQQNYGAKKAYAFLGTYKYAGKQVQVEVKNIKDESIKEGVVLEWKR